jgi:hypothetical protein
MSRIWDALQQIEQQRQERALEFVVPDRIQLTPKQLVAIQALLRTDSLAAAARLTGVGEMTMRRWLTRPGFITAFYQAGRKQLESERARLDAATENAIEKLRRAREMLAQIADVADGLRRVAPAPNGRGRPADGAASASLAGQEAALSEDETAGAG